ncbi:MAG: 50S ribosomal protein L10 [Rhodospirillales bacterium]|nr:50S ribosomal protein L10 [Rhodospirillales bacterium]MDP7625834.1 50S ribosomal protein L10 [Rhodospirillales bacterium]
MDRTTKEEKVASLKQTFEDSEMVVVTHYIGMTMPEMTDLRNRMREAGASFKVTKNRLTRLALQDTDFESLTELMTGPTALAYSADPVTAAKTAINYAKDNDKLVILGGVFNGQSLDVDDVKNLAKLPSLDELRGKLVGMIQTPATRIAGVLQAPAGQVVRVIGAYGAKGDEAA